MSGNGTISAVLADSSHWAYIGPSNEDKVLINAAIEQVLLKSRKPWRKHSDTKTVVKKAIVLLAKTDPKWETFHEKHMKHTYKLYVFMYKTINNRLNRSLTEINKHILKRNAKKRAESSKDEHGEEEQEEMAVQTGKETKFPASKTFCDRNTHVSASQTQTDLIMESHLFQPMSPDRSAKREENDSCQTTSYTFMNDEGLGMLNELAKLSNERFRLSSQLKIAVTRFAAVNKQLRDLLKGKEIDCIESSQ